MTARQPAAAPRNARPAESGADQAPAVTDSIVAAMAIARVVNSIAELQASAQMCLLYVRQAENAAAQLERGCADGPAVAAAARQSLQEAQRHLLQWLGPAAGADQAATIFHVN